MKTDSLTHQFLIAMPKLHDINFAQAVIYICDHSDEGAMGLVINKPLQFALSNVLEHLDIPVANPDSAAQPVLMGGPVSQEQGFVIHTPRENEAPNDEEVVISSSKEILTEIACGEGPKQFIVTLGYAGWEAGQLEKEIHRNDWLTAPFDKKILFNLPFEERWAAAGLLLGIDIHLLSDQVGHA